MKISIIVILLLFCSCEPYDGRLIFINNSDETFYYTVSYSNNYKESNYLTEYEPNKATFEYVYKLKPNDSLRILNYGKNSWESYIGHSIRDSLYIHTFDYKILNEYKWETIYKKNKYSSKRAFAINQLDSINWLIKIPLN